ncbi:MobA/MobL family protein [Ruegeria sp. ANG-R]|uniref:MobA/MobL family protein n=1 Tax=Ruegeria sp. ANG-R TaxID=1577903 RepID=UPI0009E1ED5B|nr:MobA/MobL family protein [Ruegeria sp. ANG-R]
MRAVTQTWGLPERLPWAFLCGVRVGARCPLHDTPASRLEVILHFRADGRSAVKSAAYTARTTFRDARVGRRFSPGRKVGLLSHELINWTGNAEELWNAAERSERRKNARVIRELRPTLPRELPLLEQVGLVRGFCLWLCGTPTRRLGPAPCRKSSPMLPGAEGRLYQGLFGPLHMSRFCRPQGYPLDAAS